MKGLVKIEIESEGDVNGFFKLHFSNGDLRQGWSCDQGSIDMDDGLPLDEEVEDFVMDKWFSMDLSMLDDEDGWDSRLHATWTLKDGLSLTTVEN